MRRLRQLSRPLSQKPVIKSAAPATPSMAFSSRVKDFYLARSPDDIAKGKRKRKLPEIEFEYPANVPKVINEMKDISEIVNSTISVGGKFKRSDSKIFKELIPLSPTHKNSNFFATRILPDDDIESEIETPEEIPTKSPKMKEENTKHFETPKRQSINRNSSLNKGDNQLNAQNTSIEHDKNEPKNEDEQKKEENHVKLSKIPLNIDANAFTGDENTIKEDLKSDTKIKSSLVHKSLHRDENDKEGNRDINEVGENNVNGSRDDFPNDSNEKQKHQHGDYYSKSDYRPQSLGISDAQNSISRFRPVSSSQSEEFDENNFSSSDKSGKHSNSSPSNKLKNTKKEHKSKEKEDMESIEPGNKETPKNFESNESIGKISEKKNEYKFNSIESNNSGINEESEQQNDYMRDKAKIPITSSDDSKINIEVLSDDVQEESEKKSRLNIDDMRTKTNESNDSDNIISSSSESHVSDHKRKISDQKDTLKPNSMRNEGKGQNNLIEFSKDDEPESKGDATLINSHKNDDNSKNLDRPFKRLVIISNEQNEEDEDEISPSNNDTIRKTKIRSSSSEEKVDSDTLRAILKRSRAFSSEVIADSDYEEEEEIIEDINQEEQESFEDANFEFQPESQGSNDHSNVIYDLSSAQNVIEPTKFKESRINKYNLLKAPEAESFKVKGEEYVLARNKSMYNLNNYMNLPKKTKILKAKSYMGFMPLEDEKPKSQLQMDEPISDNNLDYHIKSYIDEKKDNKEDEYGISDLKSQFISTKEENCFISFLDYPQASSNYHSESEEQHNEQYSSEINSKEKTFNNSYSNHIIECSSTQSIQSLNEHVSFVPSLTDFVTTKNEYKDNILSDIEFKPIVEEKLDRLIKFDVPSFNDVFAKSNKLRRATSTTSNLFRSMIFSSTKSLPVFETLISSSEEDESECDNDDEGNIEELDRFICSVDSFLHGRLVFWDFSAITNEIEGYIDDRDIFLSNEESSSCDKPENIFNKSEDISGQDHKVKRTNKNKYFVESDDFKLTKYDDLDSFSQLERFLHLPLKFWDFSALTEDIEGNIDERNVQLSNSVKENYSSTGELSKTEEVKPQSEIMSSNYQKKRFNKFFNDENDFRLFYKEEQDAFSLIDQPVLPPVHFWDFSALSGEVEGDYDEQDKEKSKKDSHLSSIDKSESLYSKSEGKQRSRKNRYINEEDDFKLTNSDERDSFSFLDQFILPQILFWDFSALTEEIEGNIDERDIILSEKEAHNIEETGKAQSKSEGGSSENKQKNKKDNKYIIDEQDFKLNSEYSIIEPPVLPPITFCDFSARSEEVEGEVSSQPAYQSEKELSTKEIINNQSSNLSEISLISKSNSSEMKRKNKKYFLDESDFLLLKDDVEEFSMIDKAVLPPIMFWDFSARSEVVEGEVSSQPAYQSEKEQLKQQSSNLSNVSIEEVKKKNKKYLLEDSVFLLYKDIEEFSLIERPKLPPIKFWDFSARSEEVDGVLFEEYSTTTETERSEGELSVKKLKKSTKFNCCDGLDEFESTVEEKLDRLIKFDVPSFNDVFAKSNKLRRATSTTSNLFRSMIFSSTKSLPVFETLISSSEEDESECDNDDEGSIEELDRFICSVDSFRHGRLVFWDFSAISNEIEGDIDERDIFLSNEESSSCDKSENIFNKCEDISEQDYKIKRTKRNKYFVESDDFKLTKYDDLDSFSQLERFLHLPLKFWDFSALTEDIEGNIDEMSISLSNSSESDDKINAVEESSQETQKVSKLKKNRKFVVDEDDFKLKYTGEQNDYSVIENPILSPILFWDFSARTGEVEGSTDERDIIKSSTEETKSENSNKEDKSQNSEELQKIKQMKTKQKFYVLEDDFKLLIINEPNAFSIIDPPILSSINFWDFSARTCEVEGNIDERGILISSHGYKGSEQNIDDKSEQNQERIVKKIYRYVVEEDDFKLYIHDKQEVFPMIERYILPPINFWDFSARTNKVEGNVDERGIIISSTEEYPSSQSMKSGEQLQQEKNEKIKKNKKYLTESGEFKSSLDDFKHANIVFWDFSAITNEVDGDVDERGIVLSRLEEQASSKDIQSDDQQRYDRVVAKKKQKKTNKYIIDDDDFRISQEAKHSNIVFWDFSARSEEVEGSVDERGIILSNIEEQASSQSAQSEGQPRNDKVIENKWTKRIKDYLIEDGNDFKLNQQAKLTNILFWDFSARSEEVEGSLDERGIIITSSDEYEHNLSNSTKSEEESQRKLKKTKKYLVENDDFKLIHEMKLSLIVFWDFSALSGEVEGNVDERGIIFSSLEDQISSQCIQSEGERDTTQETKQTKRTKKYLIESDDFKLVQEEVKLTNIVFWDFSARTNKIEGNVDEKGIIISSTEEYPSSQSMKSGEQLQQENSEKIKKNKKYLTESGEFKSSLDDFKHANIIFWDFSAITNEVDGDVDERGIVLPDLEEQTSLHDSKTNDHQRNDRNSDNKQQKRTNKYLLEDEDFKLNQEETKLSNILFWDFSARSEDVERSVDERGVILSSAEEQASSHDYKSNTQQNNDSIVENKRTKSIKKFLIEDEDSFKLDQETKLACILFWDFSARSGEVEGDVDERGIIFSCSEEFEEKMSNVLKEKQHLDKRKKTKKFVVEYDDFNVSSSETKLTNIVFWDISARTGEIEGSVDERGIIITNSEEDIYLSAKPEDVQQEIKIKQENQHNKNRKSQKYILDEDDFNISHNNGMINHSIVFWDFNVREEDVIGEIDERDVSIELNSSLKDKKRRNKVSFADDYESFISEYSTKHEEMIIFNFPTFTNDETSSQSGLRFGSIASQSSGIRISKISEVKSLPTISNTLNHQKRVQFATSTSFSELKDLTKYSTRAEHMDNRMLLSDDQFQSLFSARNEEFIPFSSSKEFVLNESKQKSMIPYHFFRTRETSDIYTAEFESLTEPMLFKQGKSKKEVDEYQVFELKISKFKLQSIRFWDFSALSEDVDLQVQEREVSLLNIRSNRNNSQSNQSKAKKQKFLLEPIVFWDFSVKLGEEKVEEQERGLFPSKEKQKRFILDPIEFWDFSTFSESINESNSQQNKFILDQIEFWDFSAFSEDIDIETLERVAQIKSHKDKKSLTKATNEFGKGSLIRSLTRNLNPKFRLDPIVFWDFSAKTEDVQDRSCPILLINQSDNEEQRQVKFVDEYGEFKSIIDMNLNNNDEDFTPKVEKQEQKKRKFIRRPRPPPTKRRRTKDKKEAIEKKIERHVRFDPSVFRIKSAQVKNAKDSVHEIYKNIEERVLEGYQIESSNFFSTNEYKCEETKFTSTIWRDSKSNENVPKQKQLAKKEEIKPKQSKFILEAIHCDDEIFKDIKINPFEEMKDKEVEEPIFEEETEAEEDRVEIIKQIIKKNTKQAKEVRTIQMNRKRLVENSDLLHFADQLDPFLLYQCPWEDYGSFKSIIDMKDRENVIGSDMFVPPPEEETHNSSALFEQRIAPLKNKNSIVKFEEKLVEKKVETKQKRKIKRTKKHKDQVESKQRDEEQVDKEETKPNKRTNKGKTKIKDEQEERKSKKEHHHDKRRRSSSSQHEESDHKERKKKFIRKKAKELEIEDFDIVHATESYLESPPPAPIFIFTPEEKERKATKRNVIKFDAPAEKKRREVKFTIPSDSYATTTTEFNSEVAQHKRKRRIMKILENPTSSIAEEKESDEFLLSARFEDTDQEESHRKAFLNDEEISYKMFFSSAAFPLTLSNSNVKRFVDAHIITQQNLVAASSQFMSPDLNPLDKDFIISEGNLKRNLKVKMNLLKQIIIKDKAYEYTIKGNNLFINEDKYDLPNWVVEAEKNIVKSYFKLVDYTSADLFVALYLLNSKSFPLRLSSKLFKLFVQEDKHCYLIRTLFLAEIARTPPNILFASPTIFSKPLLILFDSLSFDWILALIEKLRGRQTIEASDFISVMIRAFDKIPQESLFIIRVILIHSLLNYHDGKIVFIVLISFIRAVVSEIMSVKMMSDLPRISSYFSQLIIQIESIDGIRNKKIMKLYPFIAHVLKRVPILSGSYEEEATAKLEMMQFIEAGRNNFENYMKSMMNMKPANHPLVHSFAKNFSFLEKSIPKDKL